MAHSHAHAHGEAESTYFLDQLCTIAVCGLLGATAVMAYRTDMLGKRINLIKEFHVPVLVAGIALILMAVLRAAAVWQLAGRAKAVPVDEHEHGEACGHDHDPGEQCDHDHGHSHSHRHEHSHAEEHGHAHGDGGGDGEDHHDHGWAPWRYAVLIVPAVLFFLGLPTEGNNMTRLSNDLKEETLDPGFSSRRVPLANLCGATVLCYKKSSRVIPLKFSELQVQASREQARTFFEGQTVILKGQYWRFPDKDKEFSLFRVKINCCGADAITLKSRIIAPEPLQGFNTNDWVQIQGEISFQQVAGKNEWLPVIQLPTMQSIQKIDPPSDPNDGV
jgi:hypothetical protein